MSDTYQAVYDAIRSRMSWPDVEQIMRNAFDISWQIEHVKQEFMMAASEMMRPCVIFKPRLAQDGDHWIALFGDDLQVGVVGIGKSPADAMYDFDRKWQEKLA